jgi:hypothetical protein
MISWYSLLLSDQLFLLALEKFCMKQYDFQCPIHTKSYTLSTQNNYQTICKVILLCKMEFFTQKIKFCCYKNISWKMRVNKNPPMQRFLTQCKLPDKIISLYDTKCNKMQNS